MDACAFFLFFFFCDMELFCCEVTEDEFPPFWVVCAEGHVECARLLLDAGVNINKAFKGIDRHVA